MTVQCCVLHRLIHRHHVSLFVFVRYAHSRHAGTIYHRRVGIRKARRLRVKNRILDLAARDIDLRELRRVVFENDRRFFDILYFELVGYDLIAYVELKRRKYRAKRSALCVLIRTVLDVIRSRERNELYRVITCVFVEGACIILAAAQSIREHHKALLLFDVREGKLPAIVKHSFDKLAVDAVGKVIPSIAHDGILFVTDA